MSRGDEQGVVACQWTACVKKVYKHYRTFSYLNHEPRPTAEPIIASVLSDPRGLKLVRAQEKENPVFQVPGVGTRHVRNTRTPMHGARVVREHGGGRAPKAASSNHASVRVDSSICINKSAHIVAAYIDRDAHDFSLCIHVSMRLLWLNARLVLSRARDYPLSAE